MLPNTEARLMSIEERLAVIISANVDRVEAIRVIGLFLSELEKGTFRAALRNDLGIWQTQRWVKEGILAAFRYGILAEFASGSLCYIDKDTLPARRFKIPDGVRIVPGG